MQKKIDGITFIKSPIKHKKYRAILPDVKHLYFGDNCYHYHFYKIGMYSHLNHNDDNRKRLYYARHGKEAEKHSSKYFSHKYLW